MFLLGVDAGTKMAAPCISWLIEGEDGSKILVDTGPHAADAPTACYHNVVERAEVERIDQALLKHGVDPDEITTVIFTHLHWDHCYNAALLKNAKFYVQKSEICYAVDPIEWHYPAYDTKLPDMNVNPPWMEVFHKLVTVDGDYEIAPGVLFVLLPGHTPGSAGIAVKTRQGMIMVGGDTVPLIENWEGNARQKHIPSALMTDVVAYYHSFKKIEKIADKVLPAHDFRSFDQAKWG